MTPKYNIIFLDDKTKSGMKFPLFEMYWREEFVDIKTMYDGEIVNYRIWPDEYQRILIEEIK